MVEKVPQRITIRGEVFTFKTDFIDSVAMRNYLKSLYELDAVKIRFRKSKENKKIAYMYIHKLKQLKVR